MRQRLTAQMVAQRMCCEEAGGTLVFAGLISAVSLEAMMAETLKLTAEDRAPAHLFAPGCGKKMYVAGTNGGQMRCGTTLTDLAGKTEYQYCTACAEEITNYKI
jgi:hypothetical protein